MYKAIALLVLSLTLFIGCIVLALLPRVPNDLKVERENAADRESEVEEFTGVVDKWNDSNGAAEINKLKGLRINGIAPSLTSVDVGTYNNDYFEKRVQDHDKVKGPASQPSAQGFSFNSVAWR
jgi:hypothetical protein